MPVFVKSKSKLKDLYRIKKRNTLTRSNIETDLPKLFLG